MRAPGAEPEPFRRLLLNSLQEKWSELLDSVSKITSLGLEEQVRTHSRVKGFAAFIAMLLEFELAAKRIVWECVTQVRRVRRELRRKKETMLTVRYRSSRSLRQQPHRRRRVTPQKHCYPYAPYCVP